MVFSILGVMTPKTIFVLTKASQIENTRLSVKNRLETGFYGFGDGLDVGRTG